MANRVAWAKAPPDKVFKYANALALALSVTKPIRPASASMFRNGAGIVAPIRKTMMINRVNRIFFLKSGIFQAFCIVLNNSDHLSLPAGRLDLLLCSFGDKR